MRVQGQGAQKLPVFRTGISDVTADPGERVQRCSVKQSGPASQDAATGLSAKTKRSVRSLAGPSLRIFDDNY